jgi:Late competence development protein ComFB
MDTTAFRLNLAKTYINAMEILVEEEVDRRIGQLSELHRTYLNRMELIAYALNHLPALYATGEKGLEYQLMLGRTQHAPKIQQAVQQSIAAVLRDPILNYTPLKFQAPAGMREVLKRIQSLLHNETVDWETLPDILEALVRNIPRGHQIAAINSVHAPHQTLGTAPGYAAPGYAAPAHAAAGVPQPQSDFDQDITVGMAPVQSTQSRDQDKPWKRVRDRIGAKAASGVTTGIWTDSHYWQ